METVALSPPTTRILAFLNGDFQTAGTECTVDGSMNMAKFLKEAADILDITPLGITLTRAFTEDGVEITSPSSLSESAKVFVSAGEDFVTPEAAAAAAPEEDHLMPYPSVPSDSMARPAASAPSETAPEGSASVDAASDDDDDEASGPATPTPGPIEVVATTAASWMGWGYGMASSYLKQLHPPTGEKLTQAENAISARVGGYARDSAPAMRTGLRWADRQLNTLVVSMRAKKDDFMASPAGERLQVTVEEAKASVAASIQTASTATSGAANNVAGAATLTAGNVYNQAADVYRSSMGEGGAGRFVADLKGKMGVFWTESMVPVGHSLFSHMSEVYGTPNVPGGSAGVMPGDQAVETAGNDINRVD